MWERCTFKPWVYWFAARLTLNPMGRLHDRVCPKPRSWHLVNKMKAKSLVWGMFWWISGVCGAAARCMGTLHDYSAGQQGATWEMPHGFYQEQLEKMLSVTGNHERVIYFGQLSVQRNLYPPIFDFLLILALLSKPLTSHL